MPRNIWKKFSVARLYIFSYIPPFSFQITSTHITMQHKRICLGLFAAFAGLVNAADASDVTQLTKDTFDDFVKANDLVLAECKS